MAAPTLDEILARFWRTDDGMTATQRAEAYGIDISLIDENLRLSIEERLDRNQQALALIESLRTASKIMESLKDLVTASARNGVDFVLVGGFGAVSAGAAIVTRDVDVACRMNSENLQRVFNTLEKFHPIHLKYSA